jgi:hypothetical protein
MRKRHALAAVLTGTLAGALGAAAPAAASADRAHDASGPDAVAVTGGHLAADGTVTVTGHYRCLPPQPGAAVYIGSDLTQGGHEDGIGGTQAVCDGRTHTFANSGQTTPGTYKPGPAQLSASLVALTHGPEGALMPQELATAERPITLREEK